MQENKTQKKNVRSFLYDYLSWIKNSIILSLLITTIWLFGSPIIYLLAIFSGMDKNFSIKNFIYEVPLFFLSFVVFFSFIGFIRLIWRLIRLYI